MDSSWSIDLDGDGQTLSHGRLDDMLRMCMSEPLLRYARVYAKPAEAPAPCGCKSALRHQLQLMSTTKGERMCFNRAEHFVLDITIDNHC
jgi:hypothetical protein